MFKSSQCGCISGSCETFLSVSMSLKPTTFSGSVSSWYGLIRSCYTASEVSFRSMFLFSRAKLLLTEYVLGGKLPSLWMRLLVYFTWMIAYSFLIKSALSVKYSTCTGFLTSISTVSCAHQCILCMFILHLFVFIYRLSNQYALAICHEDLVIFFCIELSLHPGQMYSSANWCGFSNGKACFKISFWLVFL